MLFDREGITHLIREDVYLVRGGFLVAKISKLLWLERFPSPGFPQMFEKKGNNPYLLGTTKQQ